MKRGCHQPLARQCGFTLIEVLVVMIIVGVLASLAYPPLGRHIQRARLAGAQQALLEGASAQESLYATQYHYGDQRQSLGLPDHSSHYRFTVETPDPEQQSYILTATLRRPDSGAPCHTLSLDQAGRRGAMDEHGEDTTRQCWP